MTARAPQPTIILVPGHWLGAWAWDEVVAAIGGDRARTIAVTLPGLDPADANRTDATLQDQVDALASLVDAETADGTAPVTLVAHSGANAPVSAVLDRRADRIHRVVWVDSGPAASGVAFAPELPEEVVELPLPAWDELATQASLEGVSAADQERFSARAVAQPGRVVRGSIELSNPARFAVPTTVVCCSMSSELVRTLMSADHPMFAELARVRQAELIDLPTGHWPMWSRPADLAELIVAAAR